MVTCFARILSISALNSFCAACQRAGKAFRCVYRSFLRSSAVVSHASGDAEGSIQELPRVSSCFHSEPDMVCVAPVPTGARAAYRRITLNKAAADGEESLIRQGGVPARARFEWASARLVSQAVHQLLTETRRLFWQCMRFPTSGLKPPYIVHCIDAITLCLLLGPDFAGTCLSGAMDPARRCSGVLKLP